MLDDEEQFQEQLQEKLWLYEERSMEQDFWIVIEPKFRDKFPNVTKRLKRPAVALVSSDRNWITFIRVILPILIMWWTEDQIRHSMQYYLLIHVVEVQIRHSIC